SREAQQRRPIARDGLRQPAEGELLVAASVALQEHAGEKQATVDLIDWRRHLAGQRSRLLLYKLNALASPLLLRKLGGVQPRPGCDLIGIMPVQVLEEARGPRLTIQFPRFVVVEMSRRSIEVGGQDVASAHCLLRA